MLYTGNGPEISEVVIPIKYDSVNNAQTNYVLFIQGSIQYKYDRSGKLLSTE